MMRFVRGQGLFLLLMAVAMVACKDDNDLIPRRKLVRVLAEIHIADGIAVDNMGQKAGPRIDSTSLYSAVFKKHGVTRAAFDSTMNYYSTRPEELQEFYDQVSTILKKREEALKKITEASLEATGTEIWNNVRAVYLPEMGKTNMVEVAIPVSDTGSYTARATITLYRDDATINPRMTLYYYYDNGTPQGYRDYFQEIRLQKDDNEHTYSVTKALSDTNVTHILGTLLNHSNHDTFFIKHAVVTSLVVTKR